MKVWPTVRCLRAFTLIISVLLVFSGATLAQPAVGRLQGQILDQTGAVIPAAAITLKNSSGLVVTGKSGGAGESASRPTPAALANAIFDATGIRLRQAPFTPERLKAGLA